MNQRDQLAEMLTKHDIFVESMAAIDALLASGIRVMDEACMDCELNPGLCGTHGTAFREPIVLTEERLAEAIHQARKHPGTAERAVQWDRLLARRALGWLGSSNDTF